MTQTDVLVRRATTDDRPAILDLLADSLGWDRDDAFAEFFDWKHTQNPFGVSPAWIAVADGRTVGFRTFLRWEFEHPDGRLRHAVRAVDTATASDYQGRGVFRSLTMTAVEELTRESVDFVFNTPNDNSRPGYLRMGWTTVGRLPLVVRVAGIPSAARMRDVARPRRPLARRNHGRPRSGIGARRLARRRAARGRTRALRPAHGSHSRVPPLALRPARARLPGDRPRR